jgi:RecB family exonuclease
MRINPTRLRRFYRCEYEWYVRDVLGVDPLRPPPAPHRDRGKVFHALIEHALRVFAASGVPYVYEGDEGKATAGAVMMTLYRAEGTSLDDEASYEMLDAIRYHLERLDLASWEVVRLADGTPLIEADLRAELMPSVELQARIDVVLRKRSTGKVWLIDFKTSLYPLTDDITPFIEHDDQLAMGRHVLRANGIEADYTALLHLRSRAPEPPSLVYAGTARERTSVNAKSMSCDWETYRATLVERDEDPESESAAKVKRELDGQHFSRWQVDITSPEGQAATEANMRLAVARMLSIWWGETKPVRRLSQGKHRGSCDNCDYGKWCRASLRTGGAHALAVLGTDYQARDGSTLAGQERFDAPLFNASAAYVEWAVKQGRDVEPHQEFTP